MTRNRTVGLLFLFGLMTGCGGRTVVSAGPIGEVVPVASLLSRGFALVPTEDPDTLRLTHGDRVFDLTVGIATITVDDETREIPQPPMRIGDRWFVTTDSRDRIVALASPPQPEAVRVERPPLLASRLCIVIDPGHGGHDPGASPRSTTREKDVVLDVSRRLARQLESDGHRVILTRSDDRFIELHERAAIANRNHADIFVSIHANANDSSSVHGIETYYPTPAFRASSAAARSAAWLPPSEDDADVAGHDRHDRFHRYANESQRRSARLATAIQRSLVGALGARDNGIRQHPKRLVVLRETICPAVLVEMGYLTNPSEERRLLDAAHRNRVADAIHRGIVSYIESVHRVP